MTRINLGLSAKEVHWNDLRRRLKVNLRGKYVIAVMQSKGGVNKTSTTVLLGAALSKYRDEKIVAIDANPANGNLARRIDEPSTMSWRGLNSDRNLRDYSDFREYLGKDNHSGLEVLGSDRGRTPMTGADLITAWSKLQVQYPIAIVDCGNQLDDDLTHALLEHIRVDAIVVPSTTRLDGAQGAADTLNWLLESGYPHLVREAVVIVSNINKVNASAQVKQLHADFGRTVRSVHTIDFDAHLSDAVPIEFDRLAPNSSCSTSSRRFPGRRLCPRHRPRSRRPPTAHHRSARGAATPTARRRLPRFVAPGARRSNVGSPPVSIVSERTGIRPAARYGFASKSG
ncbi:MinD/ParA family ATP-binding protein [Mycobacterium szulgai]|uniref:MinD/ParA family ATP-binding protein n=1 Tax=Mycobacterium szulgai TaxID=1787 RepID=UPI0021F2928E|nr:AAA family ATPase [Mycobacterium szulgai]